MENELFINPQKERFFTWIDEAINNDSIGDNVVTFVNDSPRMRKAAQRYFGSVKQALIEYGFVEGEINETWTDGQILNHFDVTYTIDIYGRLVFDDDFFLLKFDEFSALGGDLSISKVKSKLKRLLEDDLLQAFFNHFGVDGFRWIDYKPHTQRPQEFKGIAHIIRSRKESRFELANKFGIRYRAFLAIDTSKQERRAIQKLGHEFQALVTEIYDEITLARSEQNRFEDSIPDFISGNTWLDAKLSKSTASAMTIQKYRKHTDWLIIVYALEDGGKPLDGAIYKHVSEYYPLISAELQRKLDAFIRRATEVRFGAIH